MGGKMKKILGLILLGLVVLTGCKKNDNTDEVTKVTKYLSGLSSYSLESKMTINRPDKNVSLGVQVDYLSPNYYKVCFKGDSEQLIIKNDSGVYVITPALNKEFRFDSDWPLNSSHAYLLEAINKDIKADKEAVGSKDGNLIVIEAKITHKTNQKLETMKYYCDQKLTPKKTVFLNDKKEEVVIVDFESFTPNSKLGKDNFNEKKYLGNQQEGPKEEETSLAVTAGYVVDGCTLKSSTTKEDVSILCYSGENAYTIVVSKVEVSDEVVAIDTYDNVEFLECGLGFLSSNTMKYYKGNYEITIFSDKLTIDDFINIASSITLA